MSSVSANSSIAARAACFPSRVQPRKPEMKPAGGASGSGFASKE